MTVFYCAKCDTQLTPELTELPAVPAVEGVDEPRCAGTVEAPSTVPLGSYAIEPEPWGAPFVRQEDQANAVPSQPRGPYKANLEDGFVISAGPRDMVVLHPDDAPVLRPLPGGENSVGCCGPAGTEGPNMACSCGNRLGTLVADCMGPYELHLDPIRIYAFNGSA